jgi:hypothetical protein
MTWKRACPRWLKLVEARLNRLLQDPDMEVVTTLTGMALPCPLTLAR